MSLKLKHNNRKERKLGKFMSFSLLKFAQKTENLFQACLKAMS